MTQLNLFPQRNPRHYDRYFDERKQSSKQSKQEKHPEEKRAQDMSGLEEKVIGDYVDLRVEIDSVSAWLDEAETYLNADTEQKKLFLMKTHPKFRGEGKTPQNLTNYSSREIFGLFNGIYKSYQKSLKKQLKKLNEFEQKHQNVLGKYAHN